MPELRLPKNAQREREKKQTVKGECLYILKWLLRAIRRRGCDISKAPCAQTNCMQLREGGRGFICVSRESRAPRNTHTHTHTAHLMPLTLLNPALFG